MLEERAACREGTQLTACRDCIGRYKKITPGTDIRVLSGGSLGATVKALSDDRSVLSIGRYFTSPGARVRALIGDLPGVTAGH